MAATALALRNPLDEPGEPRRPYAPTSNVVAVLNRARSRNLPSEIDASYLEVLQIHHVTIGRVLEALQFLGLIDPGGRPTDALRALAAAPEDEYRDLLAARIRDAYREDFERVQPDEDTQAQIVAAFQRYQPRSQTKRMVMLWLGLSREAGIPVLDAPRERKMNPRSEGTGKASAPAPPKGKTNKTGKGSDAAVNPMEEAAGLLMGVTVEDVAELSDGDFAEVWAALGKVARARGRARRAVKVTPADDQGGEGMSS